MLPGASGVSDLRVMPHAGCPGTLHPVSGSGRVWETLSVAVLELLTAAARTGIISPDLFLHPDRRGLLLPRFRRASSAAAVSFEIALLGLQPAHVSLATTLGFPYIVR